MSRLPAPTRKVNLADELDRLVVAKAESGGYENAGEVVRAALCILEHEEQRHQAKLAVLQAAFYWLGVRCAVISTFPTESGYAGS